MDDSPYIKETEIQIQKESNNFCYKWTYLSYVLVTVIIIIFVYIMYTTLYKEGYIQQQTEDNLNLDFDMEDEITKLREIQENNLQKLIN